LPPSAVSELLVSKNGNPPGIERFRTVNAGSETRISPGVQNPENPVENVPGGAYKVTTARYSQPELDRLKATPNFNESDYQIKEVHPGSGMYSVET
jgi:hypothetical protein